MFSSSAFVPRACTGPPRTLTPGVASAAPAITNSPRTNVTINFIATPLVASWTGRRAFAGALAIRSQTTRIRPKRIEIAARTWFATGVTRTGAQLEIGVLGPLEVRYDGEHVALGGAKQRALLAILLLRAGTVVPVELADRRRLGREPAAVGRPQPRGLRLAAPAAARQPRTLAHPSRRGVLPRPGDAALDVRRFEPLAADASLAAAIGDHRRTSELAARGARALAGPCPRRRRARVIGTVRDRRTARGASPPRPRTALRRGARARPRTSGCSPRCQALVGQNPYRERFVGQLMLALYRSGRQAMPSTPNERTRLALDEDLGLQPSAELRQLLGPDRAPGAGAPPAAHRPRP